MSTQVDMMRVEQTAAAVRRAIEACDPDELPWSFPRYACGDTCRILGQILHARGIEGFLYIVGEKRNGRYSSHAWLERNGWIVDITADQFADVHDPVIVTQSSPWHDRWTKNLPYPSTINPGDTRLWQLFSLVESRLESDVK